MKFIDARGRRRNLPNSTKYKVDWEADSRSKLQTEVKRLVRPYWEGQFVYEELPVLGTRLSIDLYNATLEVAIEVDGKQHFEYNKFFHGGNRMNFLEQLQRDEKKDSFCRENGITLHRICEGENLEEVVKKLLDT